MDLEMSSISYLYSHKLDKIKVPYTLRNYISYLKVSRCLIKVCEFHSQPQFIFDSIQGGLKFYPKFESHRNLK